MRLSDAQVLALQELLDGHPAATSQVTIPGRKVVSGKVAHDMAAEGWVTLENGHVSVTPAGKRALELHECARIARENDAVTCLLDELVCRLIATTSTFSATELAAEWQASGQLWWDAGGDRGRAKRYAIGRVQRHLKGMRDRGELAIHDAVDGRSWQHLRYTAPAVTT